MQTQIFVHVIAHDFKSNIFMFSEREIVRHAVKVFKTQRYESINVLSTSFGFIANPQDRLITNPST